MTTDLDSLIGQLADGVDFSVEGMALNKKLIPVQLKLDNQDRGIEVLAYDNAVSEATFKCKACGYKWTVKKAKYVTQQKRGCRKCNPNQHKKRIEC